MYTIQKIEQEILRAMKGALGKQHTPTIDELTVPPDAQWGDFAFPCFKFAKALGRNPAEIARELAPKIEPKGFIAKAEARGPFVNFYVDAAHLAESVLKDVDVAGARYGHSTIGAHKKVMVEYAQFNTHKAIHVGHVRNMVLGETVARVLSANGYSVIRATYHGDIGIHVAKTLWGLLHLHKDETPPAEGRGTWLGKIYAEATAYLEAHPEADAEARVLNQKLEAGEKNIRRLWKETRAWSIVEFKEVFRALGIKPDVMYWESDMEAPGRAVVKALMKKGIAKESQGAVIVPLEKYDLDVFVVLKSDGTTLYSTRDFALALRKVKEWNPDRSLLVVDVRQSMYFKQLFKTLELYGYKKPLVHIPYEFVTLKGRAISSRKGDVVTYEEMRDSIVVQARTETAKRHEDWDAKKVDETARSIATAAVAYGMLAHDIDRSLVFDIDTSASFEGATGPYLQYTGARIMSLLRKAGVREIKRIGNLDKIEALEKKLLLQIARYPEIVARTAHEYRPAPLAAALFELAQTFSAFYENVPVLKAEGDVRAFRLDLMCAIRAVLLDGVQLLGFELLDEM